MRALVTGASGFVGRHLVEHLEAEGDDVIGADRVLGPKHVDITDAEAVERLVREIKPQAIYHLAGWSDVGGSWERPHEVFRTNAEGTLNVLTAAARCDVTRVLAVSSADVYGIVTEADLPLTETAPLRPVTPYAASKVAADYLALQAFLGHHLGVIRVRAFNHLGPGQSERFVAGALARHIASNELDGGGRIPIGTLASRRDFTDVRDVVRAYRLLVVRGEPGEVYNVCSGKDVAVSELADRLVALANRPMELTPDPSLVRPIDLPVLRGDNTRLQATTGWEPAIPLHQTLADLLDDWRKRVRG